MAKGARSSSIKANNSALKAKVFGPVENARAERLNAKLMELISQPKPSAKTEDVDMEGKEAKDVEASAKDTTNDAAAAQEKPSEKMEVDAISKVGSKSKNRISKRKVSSRKSQMTFTTYKNGKKVGGGRKQKIY
ncbi:0fabd925-02ff-44c6-b031-bbf25dc5af29 [Sclerotinia trifoliorum]|uniref:0fabd925-02ff-44c6-b031-bbf25dc5af29 n=1 Tax=Sclerotinia trifoliorum TaxID=28548 RepID=A0A8H2ZW50_9HELO|nr:0fabd925-02ff-44c6-b031-bbf25dc5af29 [Sclerotinia trifoliorum]